MDEIIELKAALAEALAEIARLRTEIVGLKEQLRQNSRNSSRPPSSDMGRRKVPKEPAGRKPGGQPGHAGSTREIVPPEKVDEIVDQDPETCANCGTPLENAPRIDADVRQIVETPEF